jgi:hypothetical protein
VSDASPLVRRHLRIGWWTLALFVVVGLALESLHGFKARFYLDTDVETRRLMWRLAHAHGALLGVLHIAFAASAHMLGAGSRVGSTCLTLATVLLPGGFFLGGVWIHGGDPGLATAILVPPAAILVLVAVVSTALAVKR